MAVIRRQTDLTPSDEVPSGPGNGVAPPSSVDRTKSAVAGRNTAANAASRAPLERAMPRAPMARPGSGQAVASGDARSFIADTQAELKRVVWPTREEVRAGTIVTVMLLVFFSLYIFALDFGADWLFHAMGLYSKSPQ